MNPPHKANSSNLSDLISFLNTQHSNQLTIFQSSYTSQNTNNKIPQIYSTNNQNLQKIMNSSINIPSSKKYLSISLNEKEDNEEEIPLFQQYSALNDKRNQAIDELNEINEKIKDNNSEIKEIKSKLINLKSEKKQKQSDIINLLSNKESIEEIYKNQIYLLINPNNSMNDNIIINSNLKNDKETNINIISPTYTNNIVDENEIVNNDEDNFKITLNDIEGSEQSKFIEQVNNMVDDIFKNNDKEIYSSINNIINNSYEIFINNKKEVNNNNEINIANFFTKLSLFISNHSLGKFPEGKINILLRYLLLINAINKKLNKYMKFVNKKYKDNKKELNDMINEFEKNNKELNQNKNKLDKNIKEFEEKLKIVVKNANFQIEKNPEKNYEPKNINININQKIDTLGNNHEKVVEDNKLISLQNSDNKNNNKEIVFKQNLDNKNNNEEIVQKQDYSQINKLKNEIIISNDNKIDNNININQFNSNEKINNDNNININQFSSNEKINNNNKEKALNKNSEIIKLNEENNNENQLSHDVIIEYEDGIDQNVVINYEEDDMSSEYNYEKETEMINQGINPYNNCKINNMKIIKNENNLDNLQNDINQISIINKQSYIIEGKKKNIPKISNIKDENNKNLNNLIENINKENNKQTNNKNLMMYNNKNIKRENIKLLVIENNNKKDKKSEQINKDNKKNNKKSQEIKKIKKIFEIYKNNNMQRNHNRSNHKIIEIKESRENSPNSNIKKINDYTFNISINKSNKNIFTQNLINNGSNCDNIQNLKTKTIKYGNNTQNEKTQSNKSLKNNANNGKINEKFELAKKILYNGLNYNNNANKKKNKEEIITYKISSITKNELQGIPYKNKTKEDNLDDIIKNIEMDNYKRVKRIINENDTNSNFSISKNNNSDTNYNKDNSLIISPIKKDTSNSTILNKFDKKIQIKGRKNHNYISIINITNNGPFQKREEKENEKEKEKENKDNNIYDNNKIYTKKIKGNFNKKIFFEQNLLKEINMDKNNKENNNINDKLEITENKGFSENNIDILEPIKISKNIKKIDLSQYLSNNKNNNKQNDNEINKNMNNSNNENKENGINSVNLGNNYINQTPTKNTKDKINLNQNKKIKNDFFNNINATTLKITKSREIDIHEIKNTKLSIINKRNISKTIANKNIEKEKCNLISNAKSPKTPAPSNRNNENIKRIKNKNSVSSFTFKSGNENKKFGEIKKEIIINDIPKKYEKKYRHISFNNLKDNSTKRSNSLNNNNKNSELQAYKRKINTIAKKFVNISANKNKKNDKNIKNLKSSNSPNSKNKLKIINIPIGKKKRIKNDYNSNTYDSNLSRIRQIRTKKYINNKSIFDYSDLNENDKKYNTNSNISTINANRSSFSSFANSNLENLDNELNLLTKGTKTIFCYFRIYEKNNIEINLLKQSQNFEIFGYSAGYILINLKMEIIKFIQKIKGTELSFKLKDIVEIQIDQYMINVIRLLSLYKNNNEEESQNEIFTINNLLQEKEINENTMEKNGKTNDLLCNNFSFNLIVNDFNEGKIECILDNFEIYLFLIKYLEKIVEYNKNNNDIDDNNIFNCYNFKSL